MADISKDELLLGGGICHVTVCRRKMHMVNEFLLAYVMLFERTNLQQCFACLCKRIFNCCNALTSS